VRARGCLIAVAVALALVGAVAAVFGPGALRRARSMYAPISRMKDEQREFEAWARERDGRAGAAAPLGAERLDAFLELRKELRLLDDKSEGMRARTPRQRVRIGDMPAIMEGVGSLVTERFQAFRRRDMTPAEYDAIERLVYGRWLPALSAGGDDPAARERAAHEIEEAAQGERVGPVRERLRAVAASVRARAPSPPEGISPETHQLLLSRSAQIEAQPTGRVPARVPRGRPAPASPTSSPP